MTSERSHLGAIDVDQMYDRASYSRYEVCTVQYDHVVPCCLMFLMRVNQLFMACYDSSR